MTFGTADPAYAALWTGYRQALASGKAKIERGGRLFGHDVYWLSFPPTRDSLVAIDRTSYEPVAFRSILPNGRQIDYHVLLAHTEPFSAAAFRRRTHAPNPFSSESSGDGGELEDMTPGRSLELRRPWLTAGEAVAGLKLSSTRPVQVMSGGKTTTAAKLVYGSDDLGRRSLTIEEYRRSGDHSGSKDTPPGFVSVMEDSDRGNTIWTADLVSHGLDITIETGVSRTTLLEAPRALRPA